MLKDYLKALAIAPFALVVFWAFGVVILSL